MKNNYLLALKLNEMKYPQNKELEIFIEPTKTGFSAYYKLDELSLIATVGNDLPELFLNLENATKMAIDSFSDPCSVFTIRTEEHYEMANCRINQIIYVSDTIGLSKGLEKEFIELSDGIEKYESENYPIPYEKNWFERLPLHVRYFIYFLTGLFVGFYAVLFYNWLG